ncbi:MAG: hypothetical protein BWZ02_02868 [Lentisphaerae bacterium ADurb.BinA184]|nr:MAG: hypothetical protein BWZ02_02868 [Lentisphaerae bacterium ADurb.BinA184]
MAFAADADGRFWLEAEMATLLRAYPDNGAATAVDGSVGTALYMIPVRPHVAVYDVQVPRDAAYTVAFRVRRARPAAKPSPSADCSLRVDAGPLLRATLDLKGLDADGWGWVRTALSFPLGAGLHRVEWLGGMTDLWVDRLCLCPEALATPEQTGAPAAAIQRVDDAVVEFFPVFPPRGASWDGLEGLPAATTEVSLDGGKTWTAPPANLGDGELRVRTRLTGPANPGVRLKAPAPLLRLADGAQELWFEPEGGLYGLFHRGRGEWVVPPGTRSPAFSLAYQLPGMARLFGLDPEPGAGVTVRAGERSLSWVTELMDGGLAVTTTVEVGARHPGGIEDTAAWRIEVANRSDIEIRHVDFPKIQRVALGGIRADDRMLYPEAFGAPLDQPYTQAAYSYNPLIWPGTASMAWLDLADEGGGLYLAARHPDGLGVEFDTGADPDLSAVRMSFKKQICIGPGETWAGDYTTWAHPGDWHAAADAYRAWADSWMKRPAHPEWMQMCDGYGGLGGANGRFYSRYVTHALPVYQWLGVNYVQQWGMSADGEFCGLTLWMNPRYGSADDLRSSHDAMRKAGVHHTYYINSQGWFPGFSTLAKVGHIDKRWLPDDFQERPPEFFDEVGLRNFGGMLTQYGAGVNYTDSDRLMCAASRGWHDRFMTELAGRGIRDLYRSDGAYIDQMGCTFHYCHGEGHGHGKQHAASGRGYAEIARDVLAAGRRRNPDCVLGVEGITDLLAQYVNWGLWVTRPSYRGEVFLYTRPEAILFRGRANGHSGAFPSWGDCMADVFLYNRFDPIPEDADSARILRLRRRVADWMYRGRFMDERGLSVRGAPLDARWFRCNGRGREGAVINVHNWTERPGGRVGLDGSQVGGTVAAAILYTDDDRAAVVTPVVESGRVWVEVPANRNSAILLSSRVPERGGLRSYARWPGDAGPNRIEVTLVNPSPRAQSARLVLERAADLGAPDRRQTVEVPARGVTVAVVPLGDRRLGRAMTTARVRVSAGGDRERVEAVVPPVLVNGDFETDSNRDGVPDGWGTWNIMVEHQFNRFVQDVNLQEDLDGKACPERPFNGKACLKLPRAFDYQGKQLGPPFGMTKLHYAPCSQQAVYLRPGMRCRLKVLARTDPGNKGTVSVSVVGVTLADRDLAAWGDQWKTFEKEFDVPPTAGVLNYLTLTADTSEPVYFDAVSLEELGPTTAKP